jgi:kynurenine formamidase
MRIDPSHRRHVDLSHPIEAGMITYPGLPGPTIRPFLSREASRASYASGVEFEIDLIELCGNTGTSLDSPFHRYADGVDLAGLPLDGLVEIAALRLDLTDRAERGIEAAAFDGLDVTGRAVLLHTGFDRHWRTEAYLGDNPFLTAEGARRLAGAGVALVGIDSLNIDDVADRTRPAHSILLGAGIPILEHLTGLVGVPPTGARLTAVPIPIHGTGTFPVRAYATLPA